MRSLSRLGVVRGVGERGGIESDSGVRGWGGGVRVASNWESCSRVLRGC